MEAKRRLLKERLEEYAEKDVCLAFSGGIDSALLLVLCREAAEKQGTKLYAVTFDTVLHPRADLDIACRVAKEQQVHHEVIRVDELSDERIRQNPKNRCYLCKRTLFSELLVFAKEHGGCRVLEGTNGEDLFQYRPGIRAVRELGIKSPLLETGFTKAEIRQWAAELGISVAERPSTPCLATRLPYGTPIDLSLLQRIGEGEEKLRGFGFQNVRIRVHGELLRLEVDQRDLEQVIRQKENILPILKKVGVPYLTLDLMGFRSGSMDAEIENKEEI
jgi:uncharacterized protein